MAVARVSATLTAACSEEKPGRAQLEPLPATGVTVLFTQKVFGDDADATAGAGEHAQRRW